MFDQTSSANPGPIARVPSSDEIRDRLQVIAQERSLLQGLLKVAVRRENLAVEATATQWGGARGTRA